MNKNRLFFSLAILLLVMTLFQCMKEEDLIEQAYSFNGRIDSLNCSQATFAGSLIALTPAQNVTIKIPYSGGNGQLFKADTTYSKGVTGLKAVLAAGKFNIGSGRLTYTITGTPNAADTASFALNIGGQSCVWSMVILGPLGTYSPGTVHCTDTPTVIVDVINPATGKIWMDRNLGASRAATSSTDVQAYGDYYQWGRRADGHQCWNSPAITTLSSMDQPTHGSFIVPIGQPTDWRWPQNDNLWQGVNGVNNPCSSGYRLPTEAELNAERLSWSANNRAGAFASPLKLPVAGRRQRVAASGTLETGIVSYGHYWSSTVSSTINSTILGKKAKTLSFYFNSGSDAVVDNSHRSRGQSVRCIKD